MKQKSIFLLGIFVAILISVSFTSCVDSTETNKNDDATVKLDPHGAVNIDISVNHSNDTYDLLTTTKTIHDDNGSVIKVLTTVDTLPKLKLVKDTLDTQHTRQDANGDDVEVDTVITHPKDYQLYIVVKKN